MIAAPHPPVVLHELTAADITWQNDTPAPWPTSRPVLHVALAALPLLQDDIAAALITRMATTIADLGDELRAVRTILSYALADAHAQHVAVRRLATRLDEAHEARRVGARQGDA